MCLCMNLSTLDERVACISVRVFDEKSFAQSCTHMCVDPRKYIMQSEAVTILYQVRGGSAANGRCVHVPRRSGEYADLSVNTPSVT